MYKTFEDFVADSGINETDKNIVSELQKFANIIRQRFGFGKYLHALGYTTEETTAHINLYQSEKELLKTWRNTSVAWVDSESECVWSIFYNAAAYVGKRDHVYVRKEYLTK